MTALYALPTSAVPIIALEPCNADAELIALGHALDASWAREHSLPRDCSQDEVNEVCEASIRIVNQIMQTPAETTSGLKAKAKAIRWYYDGPFVSDETHVGMQLIRSILSDLM